MPDGGAAGGRHPVRAWAPRPARRGQHHQAAKRQRLHPAVEGVHPGAPVPGLRPARVPRGTEGRQGEGRQGAIREGARQRGEPGVARGQLGPPRGCPRQGVRVQIPALHGQVGGGVQDARLVHAGWRLVRPREECLHRGGVPGAHRAPGGRRQHHRLEGCPAPAGRGGCRRHLHELQGSLPVLRAANPRRQGEGRPLLPAPEGHHDEGLRPHHVWPRRGSVLQERVREARSSLPRAWRQPQQRRGGRVRQGRRPPEAGRGGGGPQGLLQGASCARLRGLPAGHHEPPRAVRRHRRRFHGRSCAGRWPHVDAGGHPLRCQVCHPRPLLRKHLRCRHQGLPEARGLRREDHGGHVQRRADGGQGGGVRLPRQDLPDPSRRHGEGDSPEVGRGGLLARGLQGGHLAHVPDQGRTHPGLGQARGRPGQGERRSSHLLAD
mmetsp:Transcript_43957/g.136350  ORF Transcript_43957/g.136350 Transcript_43957/m.136350 type:complete len:435 (+) Transcript_43957:336-1640(+)